MLPRGSHRHEPLRNERVRVNNDIFYQPCLPLNKCITFPRIFLAFQNTELLLKQELMLLDSIAKRAPFEQLLFHPSLQSLCLNTLVFRRLGSDPV